MSKLTAPLIHLPLTELQNGSTPNIGILGGHLTYTGADTIPKVYHDDDMGGACMLFDNKSINAVASGLSYTFNSQRIFSGFAVAVWVKFQGNGNILSLNTPSISPEFYRLAAKDPSKSGYYSFGIYNDADKLHISSYLSIKGGADIHSTNTITIEKWQHIALVIDSNSLCRIFRDGNEIEEIHFPQAFTQLKNNFLSVTTDYPSKLTMPFSSFKGAIAHFRLYDFALNQAQIKKVMENDKAAIKSAGGGRTGPAKRRITTTRILNETAVFLYLSFKDVVQQIFPKNYPLDRLSQELREETGDMFWLEVMHGWKDAWRMPKNYHQFSISGFVILLQTGHWQEIIAAVSGSDSDEVKASLKKFESSIDKIDQDKLNLRQSGKAIVDALMYLDGDLYLLNRNSGGRSSISTLAEKANLAWEQWLHDNPIPKTANQLSAELKAQMDKADEAAKKAASILQETKKGLSIAKGEIETLKGKLKTSETELISTKEAYETTKGDAKRFKEELDLANKSIKRLDDKVESDNKKIETLDGKLKTTETKLVSTKEALETTSVNLENTKSKLDAEIVKAANAALAATKALEEEKDRATKELKTVRDEAAKAAGVAAQNLSDEKERSAGALKKEKRIAAAAAVTAATLAASILKDEKDKAALAADAATQKFNKAQQKAEEAAEQAAYKFKIKERQWSLIKDDDLLALLPLDNFTEEGTMDYSGNRQHFTIKANEWGSRVLDSGSIKSKRFQKGLTVELWMKYSKNIKTKDHLISLKIGGANIVMGIYDVLKERMFIHTSEQEKQLDYVSKEGFILQSIWLPWVLILEPIGDNRWSTNFYGDSKKGAKDIEEFEGLNLNNLDVPKKLTEQAAADWLREKINTIKHTHKITGGSIKLSPVDDINIQISIPDSSEEVLQFKSLRVYSRVLSKIEILKSLTHERPTT